MPALRGPSVILYYSRLINQHQEKYLYLFTEMVGESGGYVGVFVGASLLDLAKLGKIYLEVWYERMKN